MTSTYDKALADWRRVAATADKAWLTYRTARERLALKRGSFAAEQKFIDASAAVARAQDNLEAKASDLRLECMARAHDSLASDARTRVPYTAPAHTAATALGETLYQAALVGR
jgi:hypothetical protein